MQGKSIIQTLCTYAWNRAVVQTEWYTAGDLYFKVDIILVNQGEICNRVVLFRLGSTRVHRLGHRQIGKFAFFAGKKAVGFFFKKKRKRKEQKLLEIPILE